MLYTIANDALRVSIRDKGAEIWSIQAPDGTEYLWQGDKRYWEDRAPNLFPQIGLCTDGKYTLYGQEYPMDIHGFVKDTVLQVAEHTDSRVIFTMTDSQQTRKYYPASFRYSICYALEGNCLNVSVEVENMGRQSIHFAVGGHPGFRLPLEEGLSYSDYRLQFSGADTVKRAMCTAGDCRMTGEVVEYPLVNGSIPLSHQLFAERVLILTDMPKAVTLCAAKGSRQVTVRYPQMNYLGIWKCLGSQAPYCCIEPWTGVSARAGVVEEYSTDPNKIHLPAGEQYRNRWSITID